MITIPSPKNRKWIVSYLGDFFGHIINAFNIDLFSSPSRIKIGKKLTANTTNSDISGLSNVYGFTTSNISDGTNNVKKVWAISDNKVLEYDSSTGKFVEDTSSNLGTVDTGSDIISVKDDSGDPMDSVQYSVINGLNGTSGFQLTGSDDNTKWAQSVDLSGPLYQLSVYLSKSGNPTDNLKISIQADDGSGSPDGTDITYVTKAGTILDSSKYVLYTFKNTDFSDSSFNFNKGTSYWLVFARDGSADTSNYYKVQIAWGGDNTDSPDTDDPYVDGELKSYNGSTWTKIIKYLKTDTFTSSGTWTVPSGVTEAIVEAWGAGGGSTTGVGGGGGGAYARKTVTGLTENSNISVVVGTSAADTDGGDSTFDTNVVVAKGGKSGTNGSAGGDASACVGDVAYSGGAGYVDSGDAMGGGSAGNSSDGSSGYVDNPGPGGYFNGADGDSRVPGGGSKSTSSTQTAGGRGEVRITYWTTALSGYPIVKGTSFYKDTVDTTTHTAYTFPLPDNIIPGELLLLVMGVNGDYNLTVDGSWTFLGSKDGPFSDCSIGVYYKIADMTEAPISVTSSSANSVSAIVYRIWNADTPSIELGYSNTLDSPSLTISESKKADWFSFIVSKGTNPVNITDAPTNYESLLFVPAGGAVNSASSGVGNRGAAIVGSYREYEGITENPGAYTGSAPAYFATATVAVPYKENTTYYDLIGEVDTEFPKATERLYLTTSDDIKFLDTENSQWYSLWKGALKQKSLNSDYPRILKSWGLGEVLFIANDNYISSIGKDASNYTDVDYQRIKVPPQYYANWMISTKNAIFAGFKNKNSDTLPSLVLYFEPYTEYTRGIEIESGATMGFKKDDNCYLIDVNGRIMAWNGTAFQDINYLPTYFTDQTITLPHRNAFTNLQGDIHFLWNGLYPYSMGVWRFDEKNIYHTASINNSLEGSETGALYFDGTNLYAGVSVSDGTNTISGIFKDDSSADKNAWFVTARIPTPNIKDNWHDIALKYLVPKPSVSTGNFVVKYRTKQPQIGEGFNADTFNGTWTTGTTITCSDTSFSTYYTNGQIKDGDEIIIRTGQGAGLLAHIVSFASNTITIDNDLGYTSGNFTFSVENWTKINFSDFKNSKFDNIASLKDKKSEWIQFKVSMSGDYALEELQLSSIPDLQIDKK